MSSVWSDNLSGEKFGVLKENIKTDVLIIGGGIAGILTAYMLKERGVECTVVEADRICRGTTLNTTAKISFQHGLIYDKLIRSLGKERAGMYLLAHRDALNEYKRLSKDIKCDFTQLDSYVYSMVDRRKNEKEVEALNSLGAKAEFSDTSALPFETAGAARVFEQAQFNPVKFAFALAKDLSVYENTKVKEIMPGKAFTECAEISYKKAVVATHFPFINKHGMYFLKMYQHRSYVLGIEGAPCVQGMYVDDDIKGLSFRNCKNLLLVGGGGHRTGKKGGSYMELEKFVSKFYPDATIRYRWAAQDCMTLDGMPYIGKYSSRTPDLYVATGFNKWGMTSAMLSGMILSDLICENHNEYAGLFSPSRGMLKPQLAVNMLEAFLGLITPTAPRCPHLGCALKYNAAEHSWDCSCHGSRFSESGEIINNPATDDKKKMPIRKRS